MEQSQFSEASCFLADNFDTYEAILAAEQQLGRELAALVRAVEDALRGREWWSDDWLVTNRADGLLWFTRGTWRRPDGDLVYFGLEGVTTRRVFGSEPPPWTWLRVSTRRRPLLQELASRLDALSAPLPGVRDRGANFTLVRDDVPKYAAGAAGGVTAYPQLFSDRVLAFFDAYAPFAFGQDALINAASQ